MKNVSKQMNPVEIVQKEVETVRQFLHYKKA